jgi:hydroxymethylpyrimidine pyrophosphatase-like HAD family hydrolase
LGLHIILPPQLADFFPNGSPDQSAFDAQCQALWTKDTLVVLHGASTRSAAIDLESKFTEAALGNVQIADYRHFAHGRHHWLAKHADRTAVLALSTPDEEQTARNTIDLIPKKIPIHRLGIPFRGVLANLAALVNVLHIVGSAGRARGIDPGRPGVPGFGRRIYHLKAREYSDNSNSGLPTREAIAVERKTRTAIEKLEGENRLAGWRRAYADFVHQLERTPFQGIVFDYDGTLCDERHRRAGLTPEIARSLNSLLRTGRPIGIATGRGKSVREALQKCIPKKYWSAVLIGYYNGGDLALLSDNDRPDGSPTTCETLQPIAKAINDHALLTQLADFEFRFPQIKVEPKKPCTAELVWDLLQQIVHSVEGPAVSVLRSSHSIDVVAPNVTKRSVVSHLVEMIDVESPSILCIGDRGQWPGNDFDLLNGSFSLSVDEISSEQDRCWNLALPGHRGPQAVAEYIRGLRSTAAGWRFSLKSKEGRNA